MKKLLEKMSDARFRRKWCRIKKDIETIKPEEGIDGMTAEEFYDLACRNAEGIGIMLKGAGTE